MYYCTLLMSKFALLNRNPPRLTSNNPGGMDVNSEKLNQLSLRASPNHGHFILNQDLHDGARVDMQQHLRSSSTDDFFNEVNPRQVPRRSRPSTADSISSDSQFHAPQLMSSFSEWFGYLLYPKYIYLYYVWEIWKI